MRRKHLAPAAACEARTQLGRSKLRQQNPEIRHGRFAPTTLIARTEWTRVAATRVCVGSNDLPLSQSNEDFPGDIPMMCESLEGPLRFVE